MGKKEEPDTLLEKESTDPNWNVCDVKFFGPHSRSIAVFGPIDRELCLGTISQIMELEALDNTVPITVYINTEGGDLNDALAIYDCFRSCKCPIFTVATGLLASAGLVILMGGDWRVATPNTIFFFHQLCLGERDYTNPETIENAARAYIQATNMYHNIIIERTGIIPSVWNRTIKKRLAETLTVREALKFKLVHAIIEPVEKSGLLLKKENLDVKS